MSRNIFWICFFIILALGLTLRLIPVSNNNFHFTMDQGDDAVHVREILERHQILLRGPETNLNNIYAGPLWYYFIATGYLLTGGHPSATVILLVVLTTLSTAAVMLTIKRKLGPAPALTIGLFLQIFWWYYDISRYGFNPFPLVPITIFVLLLLEDYWEKPKNQIIWAAVLVGLSFHTELAGAAALFLFFGLVFFFYLVRRLLPVKKAIASVLAIILFLSPLIFNEFQNDFLGVRAVQNEILSTKGVFGENRFKRVTASLLREASNGAIPQNSSVSLIVIGLLLAAALSPKSPPFVRRFVLLGLTFFALNILWFGSNTGWRPWHTASLPTVTYLCLLFILVSLPVFPRIALLFVLFAAQFQFFSNLYSHFNSNLDDQSLLKNELASIDWIYQESEGAGFYVYNYIPSVRDYSHQYLFWWHGRQKYGYVPCEYARYPGVPDFFIPGYKYYQEPKKPCSKLRFLLIEPDEHRQILNEWYDGVTEKSVLLESAKVGKITLEKRLLVN